MRVLCLLLAACVVAPMYAKMMNITVKGITICNKKRMGDLEVELWEKDTLDPDDLFMKTKTDRQGEFKVTGGEDEYGNIEPYLLIKHKCAVSKPNCIRTTRFEIDKSKINGVYDMTYVTLDILQRDDKEKCK